MIKNTIDQIFHYLVTENRLSGHSRCIFKIYEIFFRGLDTGLLKQNQKFDFSFSFKKKPKRSLRFSFNNYGQKVGFEAKIIRVFRMFSGIYDQRTARSILNFMKCTDSMHQTTIGLDWPQDQSHPRIKIYFEELHHLYSVKQRNTILKQICWLAGFDFKKVSPCSNDNIAAISIDFLPDHVKNIKTYALHRNFDHVKTLCNKEGVAKFRRELAFFQKVLSKENKGFYYVTQRFHTTSELASIKIYKIYEIRQINDFKDAFSEINGLVVNLRLQNHLNQLRRIAKLCAAGGLQLYPVIVSLDLSPHKDFKLDIYVSLKERLLNPTAAQRSC